MLWGLRRLSYFILEQNKSPSQKSLNADHLIEFNWVDIPYDDGTFNAFMIETK